MSQNDYYSRTFQKMIHKLSICPDAYACINGSGDYPDICGCTYFAQTAFGVLVSTELFHLPTSTNPCECRVFAYHIHGNTNCESEYFNPFSSKLTHYNPHKCKHPHHAGDLPPIFENNGYAFHSSLTNRFTLHEIIGKIVILHANPDDFTTDPSGNAGDRIAFGQIKKFC